MYFVWFVFLPLNSHWT